MAVTESICMDLNGGCKGFRLVNSRKSTPFPKLLWYIKIIFWGFLLKKLYHLAIWSFQRVAHSWFLWYPQAIFSVIFFWNTWVFPTSLFSYQFFLCSIFADHSLLKLPFWPTSWLLELFCWDFSSSFWTQVWLKVTNSSQPTASTSDSLEISSTSLINLSPFILVTQSLWTWEKYRQTFWQAITYII